MKKILFVIALAAIGALAGGFTMHAAQAQSVPVIQITPQTLDNGAVNASYTEMLNASTTGANGPFSWTVYAGSLPPGLSLEMASSGTGAIIAGTPTTPGAYSFTIDATNGITATTQVFNVDIEGSGAATSTTTVVPPTATATATISMADSSTLEMDLQNAEMELASLEAELPASSIGTTTGGSATTATPPTGPVFSRDLTIGSTGADVLALQRFLNQNGYPVAASGPGSSGDETNYFGSLTQAALASYQAANGISPAQGYYGSITRAKINLTAASSTSD